MATFYGGRCKNKWYGADETIGIKKKRLNTKAALKVKLPIYFCGNCKIHEKQLRCWVEQVFS